MGAKWNSMIAIVFLVAMIMAMENISGETLPQCREDCIQGCATTGALPYQCLQSCYRGCRGLPPAIKGNVFNGFLSRKKNNKMIFVFGNISNKCIIMITEIFSNYRKYISYFYQRIYC